ncbi:MAG: excinuclease ABC subunit UvrA, partial [Kiritimatiellae bacterium]|nr:excinuclease ABC subunit UvrA [Kiritimatiellia bacterium]
GEMTVVTGVSGSGKSSLAFDTVYAEGQRRYIETFSPYARQFMDRMDKPKTDRISGIPPAIAIDQTNPVRTSRSTVGTMTELNDHLKLLFARAGTLYCGACNQRVRRDTPESIWTAVRRAVKAGTLGAQGKARLLLCFRVTIPDNFNSSEVRERLLAQGYQRFHAETKTYFDVVQDRVVFDGRRKSRFVDAVEACLRHGQGRIRIVCADSNPEDVLEFSKDLHCAACNLHFVEPTPNRFSFNSPMGACPECRGFGRIIAIDYGLAIPDGRKTLAEGAVKAFQSKSYDECQRDLERHAKKKRVPLNVPWDDLSTAQRAWVIRGDKGEAEGRWYGVKGFFNWLESRSYRMHVRVMLSRYRLYKPCHVCKGARLQPQSLMWRVGRERLNIYDLMLMPIQESAAFFATLELPAPLDEATTLLIEAIRTRMRYLVDVGLGYLSLDRQSRTLSGGEVQRINLTTALGTSLVNTLFVLDEPSIGLHPRDITRLIGVLHRLRDAGNTLLVVEHDPDVIRAADRVLDMGPGPGEHGGEIVSYGTLAQIDRCRRSVTGAYLSGRKTVGSGLAVLGAQTKVRKHLRIKGASEHNLKNIDVNIPLERLVCITGVSGSGKSTLMHEVTFRALQKLKHRSGETPGEHRSISGYEQIVDVMLVDQSAIGKTTRSNPASYVGAFEPIRKRFAAQALSLQRGYTPGTFSFNAGDGRCPTCKGSGFELVEMQFLSDVYLRCADCDGTRYRPDVREVQCVAHGRSASIADVLDMTISEACAFFDDMPELGALLTPLVDVGLDYLKLGQPVPTLSGGESQRLKLAGHLAKASPRKAAKGGVLFLFDEPTTGLHFEDIARLLNVLRRLVDKGNSVVVIEHNIDVIRSSDWIIDLGPEGGDAGGKLLVAGPPEDVVACKKSHTGRALAPWFKKTRAHGRAKVREASAVAYATSKRPRAAKGIDIQHAREHNLQDISLTIPHNALTVITGVSGSGKSTLAFDILFAEGQRRYLESLNAYARQFVQPASRPDVESITGVPPTVAIEQRTSRGGRKSTVATVTEIYHFLRLLFVRLGTQYCPDCDVPIKPQTQESITADLLKRFKGKRVAFLAPLVVARKGYYTDLAKWAAGKGVEDLVVDAEYLPTDAWPRLDRFVEHDIEMPIARRVLTANDATWVAETVAQTLEAGQGRLYVAEETAKGRRRGEVTIYSLHRACPSCSRSFEALDPRLFSYNSKHGWCPSCFGTGLRMDGFDEEQTGDEILWNDWWEGDATPCPDCDGARLRAEARAVQFHRRSITHFVNASVEHLKKEIGAVVLTKREAEVAKDVLAELQSRLEFLSMVGLGYLSLDRGAPTLSGGEARRVRLAAQLGSNLRGVCYILDEPTIGLHSRDNLMLLDAIHQLEHKGNTVVVVEHDEETIRRATHVIDLGPGGGVDGGQIVGQGTLKDLMKNPKSTTGRMMKTPLQHPLVAPRGITATDGAPTWLRVKGARKHNLRSVNARLPLGRLICVTGVSGSGKSTLVHDVLYANLKMRLSKKARGKKPAWLGCKSIEGFESVQRVMQVEQTPIGKTPRSCPATYIGIWDDVRKIFENTAE